MVLPGVTNVILIQLVIALLNLTAKNADLPGPLLQLQQYHGDMLMQSAVAKIAILLQLQPKADQVEILVEVLAPEEDLPLVMVLILAVVLAQAVVVLMAEVPTAVAPTAVAQMAVAPMAAAPTVEALMVVVPTAAEALLLLIAMMTLTVTVLLTAMMTLTAMV